MKVIIAESAQIALRNSSEDQRRRIGAWIDNLQRWDSDPFVRQHSTKLPDGENVYLLVTNTDIGLFFMVEKDTITVMEIAKKDTILNSGHRAGNGET